MDPQRDTPLKRFGATWIGLFIVLSFGVASLILSPFFNKEVENPILEKQYEVRRAIKSDVDAAQAEQLEYKESGAKAQVPPSMAFPYTAKQLLSVKAAKTDQVVPGSPTDLKANSN